jgi:divalent metal cation (Fe/Co/Zn/Cd) transporter
MLELGVRRLMADAKIPSELEGREPVRVSVGPTHDDRARVALRGRRLQYVTIAWNSAECVVALVAGGIAESVALIGFGFDSAIEVTASLTALWRLHQDRDETGRDRCESRASTIIGACFLLLAAYVLQDAVMAIRLQHAPEHSTAGIVLAALSLLVMPLLARAKRRVAASLDSQALGAESRQTDLCAWLSAILLAGLGLNASLGWWWADPAAGLAMVPVIAWEGWRTMRGHACCD